MLRPILIQALALLAALAAVPSAVSNEVHAVVLGHSVQGRRILAIEAGDPASARKLLVVGCIHGNECAGVAIARRLAQMQPPRGVALWIVPDLNPDGAVKSRRPNARGVDLNRNFPWQWRLRRQPRIFNSGSAPLSEPESRMIYRLIVRERPRISIWFHQHLGVVDSAGARRALERRFGALVGLPVKRLPRAPGGVANWQNARFKGTTAFVVELPPGRLGAAAVDRYARAVLAIAG